MLGENDEWIKDLKEGDKIYTYGGGFGGNHYTLRTVKKITPKGHVRLDDDDLYKNGYHRTDSWHGYYLKQYTIELEKKLAHAARINHIQYSINDMDMRKISTDKLLRIWEILNETEKDDHAQGE